MDEAVSVILPHNQASQRVTRRLGLAWREDRVLSFHPGEPHGIWRLPRRESEVSAD